MINNNRLSWFVRSLAMASLTLGTFAACGDDDPDPVVDAAAQVDACLGHTCVTNPALMQDEAGIVRMDVARVPDGAGGFNAASFGWFVAYEGNVPGFRPDLLGPPVASSPGCFNHTGHDTFLNGYTAEIQTMADGRTYYALGDTNAPGGDLTLTAASDPTDTLTLAEATATPDNSNGITHKIIYQGGGPVTTNETYYLPTLIPDAATGFWGLDLDSGFAPPGMAAWAEPPGVDVPPDFTLVSHDDATWFSGVAVDSANDFLIRYTNDEASLATISPQLFFVIFANFDGTVATFEYACVAPRDPGAGGDLTVPSALFGEPGFPTGGVVITGAITHTVWNNNQQVSGRFDFMGVNYQVGPFSLN